MSMSSTDQGIRAYDGVSEVDPGKLKIETGATAASVWVSLQGALVAFSAEPPGKGVQYYSGGLKWHYLSADPQDLVITFMYETGIDDITSSSANLTLGEVSNAEQLCTVAAVEGDDHFTVNKTGGGSHDPKIVVTPH